VTRQNLDSTYSVVKVRLLRLSFATSQGLQLLEASGLRQTLAGTSKTAWDIDPDRPIASAICPSLHYPGTPLVISAPSPIRVYYILCYLSSAGISHVKIRAKQATFPPVLSPLLAKGLS